MAETQTNTVILSVKLDQGATESQLKQLVLDIEATKKAQTALNAERKAGKIADSDFAAQTVKLKGELKAQQTEQTALTNNLNLYRTAAGDLGNTYKGVQAQLSLAQNQYKLLEGSQDNSSESAQALTGVIDGLRNKLKETDAQQSLFARNIGNYPNNDSLEKLVQQLVRLEEETKRGTQTQEESNRAQMQIAGFRTQAMQAAAKEGKTYEETTSFIKGYSAAIRPAVVNLVQLEQEQQKVAEGSEAFSKIGFKIQQAGKQIKEVPTQVKGVRASLTDLDSTTNVFGGRVAGLKQQFTQAKQGIELARAGFTGLKGAIAATGLGVLILTLGALYEYFTKTDQGAEDLSAGMSYLKGVVSVLESVLIGAGKALVQLFKEPQKTAGEFVDFLVNNVINRVKSFGIIWDAIRNGDAKGLTNGIIQFNTGVEDGIGNLQRLGAEMKSAAEAAASISRAKDELEDIERGEIVRTERYRNEIERLIATAKDRTLTEKERLANLDRAGKLETTLLESTTNLARQRLGIIERENFEAERTGKISDEQRKAAAEAEAEVIKLQGQSATLQQVIQNRRSVLLEQEAAARKADAEKAGSERKKKDEAMLKSIEAEIAAGASREAAAAKYLDEQLKGDQLALVSAQKVRDEKKAADVAAYAADLAMLERNLEKRRVALETDLAEGRVSKEQYENRLTIIDEGGFAARLALANHHHQDENAADVARTRFHNAELTKRTNKQRVEYEKQAALGQQFGSQVGGLFADLLTEQGATLENFAANALILLLDVLEKQMLATAGAAVAEATVTSLAGADSVATYGIAGFAKAAFLTAAITAAFEVGKGIIRASVSKPSSAKFATGTVLDGPSHANGGIQLFSPTGHHFGEAEGGEVVLSKGVWNNALLRPLVSQINVLGGGAPLLPRAHMALGGVTAAGAANQLRGDSMMVDPKALGQAVAAALSKVTIETKVSNIKRGLAKDAYNNSINSF